MDPILAEEAVDGGTADLVQWTLTDHLNTVRDIAKYDPQTGTTTVVNHLVYDAFGRVTSETNSDVESLFLFTARPFDPATGLQNNLHRWYDPSPGRWLSEDPMGFTMQESSAMLASPISSDPPGKSTAARGPQRAFGRIRSPQIAAVFDTVNLYRYATNTPQTYADPSGRFPVVAVGVGIAAVGVAAVFLPDWGTDWLSDAEAHQVWLLTQRLLNCARCAGEQEIVGNLNSMTVTARFERGWLESDDISETRNGRFFGRGNRTILSADFFDRDCASQMRTLLHESYHAGTEDWTETKSYTYTQLAWAKLLKACPSLCS